MPLDTPLGTGIILLPSAVSSLNLTLAEKKNDNHVSLSLDAQCLYALLHFKIIEVTVL